jgi:hypothetical protein
VVADPIGRRAPARGRKGSPRAGAVGRTLECGRGTSQSHSLVDRLVPRQLARPAEISRLPVQAERSSSTAMPPGACSAVLPRELTTLSVAARPNVGAAGESRNR